MARLGDVTIAMDEETLEASKNIRESIKIIENILIELGRALDQSRIAREREEPPRHDIGAQTDG